MKKIFLILFCLLSYSLFAQQTGVGYNWSCLGNVSIGTTSATAKLNVVGASILNGNITSKAGIYFQERFGDSALFDIHGTDYQSSATMGIGSRAGRKSQTSGGCTYVGSDAGYSNIVGDYNTYIGGASGYKNLSDANTFIGYDAGRYNINGKRNTIIGAEAGTLSTFNGSNNIFIGYNVAAKEKGSNKIYIDGYNSGADSTTSTIYADQKNHLINFYNKVSINGTANTSQTTSLYVNGRVGVGTITNSDANNKFEIYNDIVESPYPDSGFVVTTAGDVYMGYPLVTSKGYAGGQPILQMQSRATNVFPYIYMRNHDNTMGLDILPSSTGAIKFNNRYDNDNADFSFTSKTDGEDERFLVVFKGSGNVGIGITNPTAKFVVKANKTVSTDSILLFNGNLGIGITAPVYKLDINGDSRFDGHVGLGGRTPSADKGVEYSENWELTSSSVEKIGAFFMPRFYATASGVEEPQVGLLGRAFLSSANTQNWTSDAPIIGNEGSIYTEAGSTGTINSAISFYVHPLLSAYGANVTNHYGIKVQDPGGVGKLTNNYGLYVSNLTSGTNNYSIYSAGGTNYFAGNVGVGTTSPAGKLQVGYDIIGEDSTSIITNAGVLGLGTTAPSGRFHVKNSVTGNDSDFCVRKSGRVGIGTTNPLSTIHLWTSNGQTARLRMGHSENGRAALADSMSGLELQMTSVTANQYSPVIKFQSNDAQLTTTTPKPFAMIAGRATQTYDDDNDGGGAIDFATNANNPGATAIPTVRMTIDQSGNVGIGSTVPTHKLQVTGGYAMADSLIIPNTKPKAPVAGAMRWSNDTLYFYNGSAWKWAVFN